jgi:hypothetical protein
MDKAKDILTFLARKGKSFGGDLMGGNHRGLIGFLG